MAAGDVSKSLVDLVRAHLGEASQQGMLTVDIYAFLNRAQYQVARRLNDNAIPELCEIATGSLTNSRVGLPSDFIRERYVDIGATNIRARRWNISELDALDNNTLYTPSPTKPYYYIWYNATDAALRLHVDISAPTSSSAYALHYIKAPTDMSDSLDPILTADKHGMLVACTLWMCWHQMGQPKEAERQWREFIKLVNAQNSRHRRGGRRNESKPGDIG